MADKRLSRIIAELYFVFACKPFSPLHTFSGVVSYFFDGGAPNYSYRGGGDGFEDCRGHVCILSFHSFSNQKLLHYTIIIIIFLCKTYVLIEKARKTMRTITRLLLLACMLSIVE